VNLKAVPAPKKEWHDERTESRDWSNWQSHLLFKHNLRFFVILFVLLYPAAQESEPHPHPKGESEHDFGVWLVCLFCVSNVVDSL
jgi:hypothetical protein